MVVVHKQEDVSMGSVRTLFKKFRDIKGLSMSYHMIKMVLSITDIELSEFALKCH